MRKCPPCCFAGTESSRSRPHSAVAGERLALRFLLRFGIWRGGLLQQPAATLLLQPITVAADCNDVAVVQQTIKDRGGDHGVAEDRVPLADAAVAGKRDRASLVTAGNEMEEHKR